MIIMFTGLLYYFTVNLFMVTATTGLGYFLLDYSQGNQLDWILSDAGILEEFFKILCSVRIQTKQLIAQIIY